MRTLFKGGTVVSGQGTRPADVLVEAGPFPQWGPICPPMAHRSWTAPASSSSPASSTPHTHFDLAVAGTVTADDFATGSRAALRGGTTTVIDYAAPDKGETLAYGLAKWRRRRRAAAPATTAST